MPANWEVKAAEKKASIYASIPLEWRLGPEEIDRAAQQRDITGHSIQQFLNDHEKAIITKDSVEIVEKISQGTWTAVQVTKAFCKTAGIAAHINNCLHEVFFDQAIKRAEELDAYYAEHKTTVGPLHGLPISLKDQFHVKGVDTTMGYVGHIGGNMNVKNPAQFHKVESQMTTELLSLGAVLYCKTSVVQTLLWGETENNIIGRTLNPNNQNLSSGGSTGGEGALLALRGSTLGVGTDIGGSVRIPAAFNGVFSIKPSTNRLSYREVANTNPGQSAYPSTVGFLSTSLGGLNLAMRSILSTKPWLKDPTVIPMPFRQDIVDEFLSRAKADGRAKAGAQPLKLGVLWNDGAVGLHPPVARGIQMVVDAVKQGGHKVVDWKPPSQPAAGKEIHFAFLAADGCQDIHSHLSMSGEPLVPMLRDFYGPREPIGLLEYQDLTLKGLEYEEQYSDYWNSTAESDGQIVDAVIMPVAPSAAVIPGKFYHIAYTHVLNMLDYSIVVIPVTRADKAIDKVNESYQPLNEIDKLNHEAYDPEIYHGGPVGIQIVARKLEEEKILAIAKIVAAALESSKAN